MVTQYIYNSFAALCYVETGLKFETLTVETMQWQGDLKAVKEVCSLVLVQKIAARIVRPFIHCNFVRLKYLLEHSAWKMKNVEFFCENHARMIISLRLEIQS